MPNPYNSPRMGLGLSEERKAEIRQANRLKQELYAQQKKIQFSNLLERSDQDVDAYIESQNNVFISSLKSNAEQESSLGGVQTGFGSESSGFENREISRNISVTSQEDDGTDSEEFDFLLRRSLASPSVLRSNPLGQYVDSSDELEYDPIASQQESLRDHLLNQLHFDGRFISLESSLLLLCEKIVDQLDPSGYLKLDRRTLSPSPKLASNAIAYPEENETDEQIIDDYNALLGCESTRTERWDAKNALDDYFATETVSKSSRRLAREEFDRIVGKKTTKEERESAKKLLDSLDFNQSEIDPLDALFPSKPTSEERALAEKALHIVQSLDPPGCGARNLQESLILRLRPDAVFAKELRSIISSCFDDFCKKRIGVIADKTGLSQATINQIYAEPFPFLPSPEQIFSSESTNSTHLIHPEIIVEETKPGRWQARLDNERDDVELDSYYRKMLYSKRIDKQTKEYLRRQLVEAQALLDALKNRNLTLLRVAKAVVDFQADFFEDRIVAPRPLTQQQIADKLGLDSSTVSRACNDKWLATPKGFVSFKTFFPKAVVGDVTSSNVADRIKELINEEDKRKPYSDEELTRLLKSRYKIDVSRKTVQEHRDGLLIPNSRARRKSNII